MHSGGPVFLWLIATFCLFAALIIWLVVTLVIRFLGKVEFKSAGASALLGLVAGGIAAWASGTYLGIWSSRSPSDRDELIVLGVTLTSWLGATILSSWLLRAPRTRSPRR